MSSLQSEPEKRLGNESSRPTVVDSSVNVRGMPRALTDESNLKGINLVSPRPFEPQTALFLLLKTAAEAKVVQARATADGKWILGCGFSKELAEEELQTLLSQ